MPPDWPAAARAPAYPSPDLLSAGGRALSVSSAAAAGRRQPEGLRLGRAPPHGDRAPPSACPPLALSRAARAREPGPSARAVGSRRPHPESRASAATPPLARRAARRGGEGGRRGPGPAPLPAGAGLPGRRVPPPPRLLCLRRGERGGEGRPRGWRLGSVSCSVGVSWAPAGPAPAAARPPSPSPLGRPAAVTQGGGAEAGGGGGRRERQLRHSPAAAIRGKIGRPAPPSSGCDRPSPRYPHPTLRLLLLLLLPPKAAPQRGINAG